MIVVPHLNLISALTPPDGEVSNFHSPISSAQVKVIAASAITFGTATLTLLLRMYTRIWLVRKVSLDDYALLVSWLFGVAFLAALLVWMRDGFAQHQWNVTMAMFLRFVNLSPLLAALYPWAPAFGKFSLLILYHRINPDWTFRIEIYCIGAVVLIYTLTTTVVASTVCKPNDPRAVTCVSNLALAQAILNIVSDVAIIILPLPMVYRLQIRTAQKIALYAVVFGGVFIVAASIVRLIYFRRMSKVEDETWNEADVVLWSAVEINIGIICNSVVALRPLLSRIAKSAFGSSYDYSTNTALRRLTAIKRSIRNPLTKNESQRLESTDKIMRTTDERTEKGLVITKTAMVDIFGDEIELAAGEPPSSKSSHILGVRS